MGWPPDIVPSREETDERARKEREERRKAGLKTCPKCKGTGYVTTYIFGAEQSICPKCNGTGVIKR